MADRNLYEILGIAKDATTEEIRKAYKKRALQTHPDRLPQGASAEEKASSEEQFRRVNNAYEVLNSPQNRRTYDRLGVWPPPEDDMPSERHGHRHGHGPYHRQDYERPPPFAPFESFFSEPFGGRPRDNFPRSRHRSYAPFAFTDPFRMFEEAFGHEFDGQFRSRARSNYRPRSHHNYDHDEDRFGMSAFPVIPRPFSFNFPIFSDFGMGMGSDEGPSRHTSTRIFSSEMRASNHGGRWISERTETSNVNGVIESRWERIDNDGRKHITHTFPDGTTRYTIDGVDQAKNRPGEPAGFIPPPPTYAGLEDAPLSSRSSRSSHHTLPPPPPGSFGSPVPPEYEQERHEKEKRRWWRGHGASR